MALATLLGLAALAPLTSVLAHSKDDMKHMGALGLMWPPDREWNEDEARTAPCGSPTGVVNRTEYPLSGASLALEQKDMAYDVQVYISFSDNPDSNDDFELLSEHPISSLDFDHVCVTAPDLPSSASADQNATLQLRYVAPYLDPNHEHRKRHTFTNETFYACSDVTLVPVDVFTFEIPCFNVSATEGHRGGDEEEGHHHEEEGEEEGNGGGLSKEAIAGVVIGCVVGVGALATLGWYLWRRDRREVAVARQVVEAAAK